MARPPKEMTEEINSVASKRNLSAQSSLRKKKESFLRRNRLLRGRLTALRNQNSSKLAGIILKPFPRRHSMKPHVGTPFCL
jgi:hypothetical protein